MRRWFARAVLVAGSLNLGCLSLGSQLHAQQDALTEIFGQGVHRYFAGDYAGAELLLNEVQAGGSEDPRVHYFLGMCKVVQGGGAAAGAADFEAGARAEARSKNSYQIGLSLTRIQGPARREIEKARMEARAQFRQQQLLEQRSRLEAAAASGAAVGPSTVAPPANNAPPAAAGDPLGDGMRAPGGRVDPVQPTAPDTSDPFGDDPNTPAAPTAPGTKPAAPDNTDPFGSGAAPATEPAMDPTDPFGTGN